MKRTRFLPIVLACLIFATNAIAQKGTVDTEQVFVCKKLKGKVPYSVYLPHGYEKSNKRYPVLYLLHGMSDYHKSWATHGKVDQIADKLIADGKVPKMIVVMPDGLKNSFYINDYDGSILWEDFFYSEFIPNIEKTYRIIGDRDNRAIGGLSMGGYGALYHALSHPDMFSSCYAMSAAVRELPPITGHDPRNKNDKVLHAKLLGPLNEDGLPENYKKHSIHEIVRAMDAKQIQALPKLYIDCGNKDYLLMGNISLSKLMKEKNIPHEFKIRDGAHTWDYWRSALELALPFAGDSFKDSDK